MTEHQQKTTESPAAKTTNSNVSQSPAVWHPFETLRGEIDRLFDEFGRGWPLMRNVPMFERMAGWKGAPQARLAVDLVETPQAYELSAELPGLTDKDIELKMVSGCLQISGEKRDEHEEKQGECWVSERSYGRFERSFRLPDDAIPDQINADFSSGVLKVRIPRKAVDGQKEQKINIKSH